MADAGVVLIAAGFLNGFVAPEDARLNTRKRPKGAGARLGGGGRASGTSSGFSGGTFGGGEAYRYRTRTAYFQKEKLTLARRGATAVGHSRNCHFSTN